MANMDQNEAIAQTPEDKSYVSITLAMSDFQSL